MQETQSLSIAPGHVLVEIETHPDYIGGYATVVKAGRTPTGIVRRHGPPDQRFGPAPQAIGTRVLLPTMQGRKFKDANDGLEYAIVRHADILAWDIDDDLVLMDRM